MNLDSILNILKTIADENIFPEIVFMFYFLICIHIYFIVILLILLFRKKLKTKNFKLDLSSKIFCSIPLLYIPLINYYRKAINGIAVVTIIFLVMFGFCTFLILLDNFNKKKYIKNKILYTCRIYPECKKINIALDDYIKKSSYKNVYKLNRIYNEISGFSKNSIRFFMDTLNHEINNNNSIRVNILFLLGGSLIGSGFIQLPTRELDSSSIIINLFILLTMFFGVNLFIYFVLDSLFDETIEMKKVNILKKFLDSLD